MISTLFRFEARGTRNALGVVFAASTLVTGVGALLAALRLPVMAEFGIGLACLGAFGLTMAIQILLVVWYYRSGYGRIGYLTHSVPVKGSTIFWVKLLWATLIMLVGTLWTCVLAFVAWLGIAGRTGRDPWEPFHALGQVRGSLATAVPGWIWVALVVLFVFSQVASFAQYFFAVSTGSEGWFGRLGLGGPVLMWFIEYTVFQILLTAATFLIPLGIGWADGRLELESANFLQLISQGDQSRIMPIGYIPALVLLIAVILWRTAVSWDKKVSLT